MKQSVWRLTAAALCACVLSACSGAFDVPVTPDGYEAVITDVSCNNAVTIVFEDTESYELPIGCNPVQRVMLAGVSELSLPLPSYGYDGMPYAEEAFEWVRAQFLGKRVYFEAAEEYIINTGYNAVPALLYLPYDSYADKISVNELILENGCGTYTSYAVPEALRWDFEQAAREAREEKRGMYSSHW